MKWKEMLHSKLAEEGADHDAYLKIAELAEAEHCCHEAGVLRDIAHDEKTHHHLIKEMMGEDNGHETVMTE